MSTPPPARSSSLDPALSASDSTEIPSGGGAKAAAAPKRCAKCAGPTLSQIFGKFVTKTETGRRLRWVLEILAQNCNSYGYGGAVCGCAMADVTGALSFCGTHGAEALADNVSHFLTYFVPKKMGTPGAEEMGDIAEALRALVEFCVKEGYVERGWEVDGILREIGVSAEFDACAVREELQQLAVEGWWDALAPTGMPAELVRGEDVESEFYRSSLQNTEMYREVSKLRKDAWVFKTGEVLKLPEGLAEMGLVGMNFSCFRLEEGRNGYWKPAPGQHHPDVFVGNVYPPS